MSGFESIFMHPQYLQLAVELNFVSQHVKMVAFPWKQNQNFLRRGRPLDAFDIVPKNEVLVRRLSFAVDKICVFRSVGCWLVLSCVRA